MESSFTLEATQSVIILPSDSGTDGLNPHASEEDRILDKILEYLSTTEANTRGDTFTSAFQFIFFIKDTAHVKVAQLTDMVDHYSQSSALYMSGGSCGSKAFNLGTGILVNNKLLSNCGIDRACWQIHCNPMTLSSYRIPYKTDGETMILNDRKFSECLIAFPVYSATNYYNLHYLWLQLQLQSIHSKLSVLSHESSLMNEYSDTHEWPDGLEPSFKASDRFDIVIWQFYNETHCFMPSETQAIRTITRQEAADFASVREICHQYLNKKYDTMVSLEIRGIYRKLDITRGIDYIIDLRMSMISGESVSKRLQIVRMLNPIEVINKVPIISEHNK